MSAQFITLTDPKGGKIAFNVALIIAVTPVDPSGWARPDEPIGARMLSAVGIAGEGTNWQHWDVRETFDEVLTALSPTPAIIRGEDNVR